MITWPNILTVLRILLIPLVIIALLEGRRFEALVFFVVAGVSDALDGLLARTLNQKSQLGAVLDPVADKFLLDSIYVICAWKGFLPAYLAVLVVTRDALIIAGFLILYLFVYPPEPRPTILSKANTVAQVVTAAAVLASAPKALLRPLFFVTATLTVSSGLHYLYLAFRRQ